MRAVTVYRLNYGSNGGYRTRQPIGSALERRKQERVNNYNDLLRLARILFALGTADVVHIIIDGSQFHQATLQELTSSFSAG